ncbi:MAG: tRNA (N6-isopentenyl adenosine(37)-C2)-methylthiotransferase MiaB [Oscillospiraceae bacterium]|nr:tRNA (N6-isopentenyl adenosine(37)-C2)-methylthiotransferase MiaB [Oscillospiraceae bacterium]
MTEITELQIEEQRAIMARVRGGHTRDVYARVMTFGCQQNEADSERLRGMLLEMGYAMTGASEDADVIIINTCAVREHAEDRVFGVIGALVHQKRARPDMVIAVCGCMAQQEKVAERIRGSYKHVDLVFGTHALWRLPELLSDVLNARGSKSDYRVFSIDDEAGSIAEGLPQARDGQWSGIKAWLSVMYGCNNFCAYCIVPHVRGRERSRRVEAVLSDARELVRDGYRDITLLGQNVNSYGRGTDDGVDFPELLRRINDIDGEFLIRFMTSHPKDAGERLFRAMAESGKVARHLHLPFQAGNNRVLQQMNRGYTRERYLELVAMARDFMPDLVLTSDVIVGFPGETLEEFEDTLRLVETARFDAMFTFIYSPRNGTPAAKMEDNTPREEKQRRFDRLLALQNGISEEKHRSYVGKTVRVLVDAESGDAALPYNARTSGNRLVRLSGSAVPGEFVDALITAGNTWSLVGVVIA